MTERKGHQVLGIDVARFIAAALVASLHLWGVRAHAAGGFLGFALASTHAPIAEAVSQRLPGIAFVGSVGVQVFFAISGIVIAYSAVQAKSWKEFLYNRFLRLAPTLWVCTLISASIGLAYGYFTPGDAALRTLRSLVIFPAMPKVDDVVWTLNLEVAFYLVVAVMIALGRAEKILQIAYALTTLSFLYWSSYYAAGCSDSVSTAAASLCGIYVNPYSEKLTSLLLVQHGAFFSLGIFVWSLCVVGRSRASVLMLLATIAACVLQLNWTASYYYDRYGDVGAPVDVGTLLTVWALIMAMVVISMMARRRIAALLSRWETGIRVVGRATYPLYLLHGFVGGATVAMLSSYGWTPLLAFLAALCVSIAAAALVAVYVEPLATGAMRRGLSRRAARFLEPTEARR